MYENSLVLSQEIGERPSSTGVSKKFNNNVFLVDLQRIPWNNICNLSDPNDMWKTWKTMFLTIYDIHAPIKTKRIRSVCAPWLNKKSKEAHV